MKTYDKLKKICFLIITEALGASLNLPFILIDAQRLIIYLEIRIKKRLEYKKEYLDNV